MDPAIITMLAKAAVAALSDKKLRKTIGWVIAAILSPIILSVVLICFPARQTITTPRWI